MGRYNFKQYMFALSTVGILNSACSVGSGRLGVVSPSGSSFGLASNCSGTGTKEASKAEELYVQINLHGIGKNRDGQNEFAKLEEAEKNEYGERLSIITPIFRSTDNRDFTLSLKDQAKGIYEEVLPELKKLLEKYKSLNINIQGSSQGGILAFPLAKLLCKFGFGVRGINLINTPLMGLPFFNCSLVQILEIEPQLIIAKSLPFPIKELLEAAKKACENHLGHFTLGELVNSQNNPEQYTKFKKLIGNEYINLLNTLNEGYKGIVDIDSYKEEMWETIRGGKGASNSGFSINIFHGCIDQSNLDPLMGLVSMFGSLIPSGIQNYIQPIIKSVKVINGMDRNGKLELTDGIIPGNGGTCKRRESFSSSGLEQRWMNLPDKGYIQLSSKECKNNGYQEDVSVTMFKGYIHESPDLGFFSNMLPLPSALLDSSNFYSVIMKNIDNCLISTEKEHTKPKAKFQDDDDLD